MTVHLWEQSIFFFPTSSHAVTEDSNISLRVPSNWISALSALDFPLPMYFQKPSLHISCRCLLLLNFSFLISNPAWMNNGSCPPSCPVLASTCLVLPSSLELSKELPVYLCWLSASPDNFLCICRSFRTATGLLECYQSCHPVSWPVNSSIAYVRLWKHLGLKGLERRALSTYITPKSRGKVAVYKLKNNSFEVSFYRICSL